MRRLTSALILIGALGFGPAVAATPSVAATPEESTQVQQTRMRARLSDRQVQNIVMRIRTNAETLLRTLGGTPDRGRIYGNQRQPGDAAYLVEDLITAADHLDDHIGRQAAVRADIDDLLRRAEAVEGALARTSQSRFVQSQWNTVRRDVDNLANAYSLNWDWRNPTYSNDPVTGVYTRVEGTYTLDASRSDDSQRVINAALRNVSSADRMRVERQLQNRLDPPDRIAIDRNGAHIIVASSRGPQFTFDADGQPRTETGQAGQTITTRAATYGDRLTVTTTGVMNNEYGVIFEPLVNGDELRVTRRLYIDALPRPVTLQTVYRRTSTTPDWNLYNSNSDRDRGRDTYPGRDTNRDRTGTALIVPDGTVLTATLDQTVNVRDARDEDRITLTVRNASRAELEGATIEGVIVNRGSVTNERARIGVQFDRIRLRNGRSGEFDGVIESITSPNGQTIRFDGELASVDRSTSGDAMQRGAIGAVVGGLIGALAGGGKGAVIGAAIGGGGAAATVLLDQSSQVELVRGTQFTIRARAR